MKYAPVEIETHDEFSDRLAARPDDARTKHRDTFAPVSLPPEPEPPPVAFDEAYGFEVTHLPNSIEARHGRAHYVRSAGYGVRQDGTWGPLR